MLISRAKRQYEMSPPMTTIQAVYILHNKNCTFIFFSLLYRCCVIFSHAKKHICAMNFSDTILQTSSLRVRSFEHKNESQKNTSTVWTCKCIWYSRRIILINVFVTRVPVNCCLNRKYFFLFEKELWKKLSQGKQPKQKPSFAVLKPSIEVNVEVMNKYWWQKTLGLGLCICKGW